MEGFGIEAGSWLRPEAATVFGEAAAAYAEHRPGYPQAAVRWALGDVCRPGVRVLDLAAGTGKLTEALTLFGADVVAVDPDPAMLAELRRRFPGATALRGTAERIPLPDAGVDVVLVGQAFHWFDRETVMDEIRRVLGPAGQLAALWNLWDDGQAWVRGLAEATGNEITVSAWRPQAVLPGHPGFLPPERGDFAHEQRRTTESMMGTVATYSYVIGLPDDQRAAYERRVRAYLRSCAVTRGGSFSLPHVTTVVRTAVSTPRPAGRPGA
ncbi:class I SAM-dependent methyltransferase [Streptomycetaceae bacterium NBC_01309]